MSYEIFSRQRPYTQIRNYLRLRLLYLDHRPKLLVAVISFELHGTIHCLYSKTIRRIQISCSIIVSKLIGTIQNCLGLSRMKMSEH